MDIFTYAHMSGQGEFLSARKKKLDVVDTAGKIKREKGAIYFDVTGEEVALIDKFDDLIGKGRRGGNERKAKILELIRDYVEALESGANHSTPEDRSDSVSDNTLHAKEGGYSPKHRRWHDALEDILSAGHKPFITGLKANLDAWSDVVRMYRELNEIGESLRNAPKGEPGGNIEELKKRALERLAQIAKRHPGSARIEG